MEVRGREHLDALAFRTLPEPLPTQKTFLNPQPGLSACSLPCALNCHKSRPKNNSNNNMT
jgi:hypothetical protein